MKRTVERLWWNCKGDLPLLILVVGLLEVIGWAVRRNSLLVLSVK